MNRTRWPLGLILILLLTVGCAAGTNRMVDVPDEDGHVAGFLHGLWNGFIVLFTFIISLFRDDVQIYEVHNSGNWYNFGFLLGVMAFFGGGGKGTCKRRKK